MNTTEKYFRKNKIMFEMMNWFQLCAVADSLVWTTSLPSHKAESQYRTHPQTHHLLLFLINYGQ